MARKTYGNTWWGQQWLDALLNIDYTNRLPRGRSYANTGRVQDMAIKKNKLTAKVQGRERAPYKVQFTIPTFSTSEKELIVETITQNPLHLSRLLNRILPTDLKAILNTKDIQLFPSSWNDLSGSCNCLDHAVPCKHMAAVLYLIANEIDKNPFVVFQLHDFDLFKALKKEGYTDTNEQAIPIVAASDLQQVYTNENTASVWDDEVFNQLDFSRLPDCKENLLAILSDKPVFYISGDFKQILSLGYSSVAKALLKRNEVPAHDAATIQLIDKIEAIEILLDETMGFLNASFRDVNGKVLQSFDEMPALEDWLQAIPMGELSRFSTPLKSLVLIYQFALKISERSAYVPQLLQFGANHYKIRWMPALLNPVVRSMHAGVRSIVDGNLLFYKKGKKIFQPIDTDELSALITLFVGHTVHKNHRLNTRFREHEVGHLFFNGALSAFNDPISKEYPALIQLWLNKFFVVDKKYIPVVLVDDLGEEGFKVEVVIEQKSSRLSAPITLAELLGAAKYKKIRMSVLRDLAMLSDYFPQIDRLVASGGAEPLFFNSKEFVHILHRILPTIGLFGIKVLLPKALRKLFRPRLSMKIREKEGGEVKQKKSILNLNNMLNFEWQIAIGNQLLSQADFLKLINDYEGIVKLQDQYIFLEEDQIATLIEKLKDPPKLTKFQLLKTALTENYDGAKVAMTKNIEQLIDGFAKGTNASIPKTLKATLRPYQKSGYEWLYKNASIGFGSIIADDMGLGKTLQVITTLLKLKETGELDKEKALIIVPTSLLTNWEKEIEKFAPALKTHVYHGANRDLKPLAEVDVLITTYGIARTENALLKKHKWLVIAIDEAQNIKNPGTAQTKAIKQLKAPIKIAMSGTPVENRLSEYWSIFDFANKGYLDSLTKFKDTFARPIEQERDHAQLEKFKKITAPFILRRLKSDKSIIKDLPDKIEIDQYCQLTEGQTAIYQNVINITLKSVAEAKGIERKGLVLKLLTALKQVCNHPRQFLKKGEADSQLSGKSILLFEILRAAQSNGEKTLIFTQYQEMGNLLATMIKKEMGLDVPFLHGGVSRKGRDQMVDQFQNNRATRIFILSLKAGGTGLNLTKASNVIHYDLWWNPAVEAQATDRAYRIGQQNNVMVHRFITKGTFEEKIDELLKTKKELANLTVATGDKWIGDLSNDELSTLVGLA